MRTQRSRPGRTDKYVYNGSQLMQMKRGTGNTLDFTYDATGRPTAVTLNGTLYYYVTNLQGDITAIVDTTGATVVTYTYDAWGKSLGISGSMASTLGQYNPLRYRGYVYDQETGLYYLQSRYYNPETGRFINADGLLSTGQGLLGNNMFAYCGNNPSNCADSSGDCCYPIIEKIKEIIDRIVTLIGWYISRYLILDEEEKVLIATVAAEATVTANGEPVSSQGRQAIANVALNRVGTKEWSQYNSVSEICAYTGFDGYNTQNYYACMDYLNNRDFSNATYESIIWDVAKAYMYDITNGCQLFYTPASMTPPGSRPDWDFSKLEEVIIPNIDTYYEGKFFKYS